MTGSQGTDDLEIATQGMDEGAGDKRPGADEAWGCSGCRHASAGLSCGRGNRQRVPGALRHRLEDSGRQVSRSLIETFLQASRCRLCIGVCCGVCLCVCDNECVRCVSACLCE